VYCGTALEGSDAVETGGRLQTVKLIKVDEAAVTLHGENADGSGGGVERVQVSLVRAYSHVERGAVSRVGADDRVPYGRKRTVWRVYVLTWLFDAAFVITNTAP
jgi:hypothetical protein